jgi:pyrimidine deaminase RibD-like protein
MAETTQSPLADRSDGWHFAFLDLAIAEADKATPKPGAFCVGCVIVVRSPSVDDVPVLVSRGYSRELPGNTHAEANALSKLMSLSPKELAALPYQNGSPPTLEALLSHTDVYTTMEPCSVRTSGLPSCADALIAANVRRCFIGVGEPDDFVKCEGAQKMRDAGVVVVWVRGLEEKCLAVARKGHNNVAAT